jgi:YggT family protein
MDSSYFTDPVVFLIRVLFGAYILVVMLRFLLQWLRADFYNPLSQFVVKATTPVLRPMRRVIPGFGGIDVASLVLMWLLQALELGLILLISGAGLHLLGPLLWALPELLDLLITLFLVAIVVQALLSWINPGTYSPATALLHTLTEPLLQPARRLIPPISGLDLSPMIVILALYLAKMLVLPPLQVLAQSPFR